MSNLVGRGQGQLPTVSMLGGLAFQNPQNVRVVNFNVTAGASFGKITPATTSIDGTSIALSIVTNSAATYTIKTTDTTIIQTTASSVYTFPSASDFPGRLINILMRISGTVSSSASNIVPLIGGAAGSPIIATGPGKWACLQAIGANWEIISAN